MTHSYQSPDKHVGVPSDFPENEHWVILTYSLIHIPGDERSRTCPGHGYPAEDKNIVNYDVYFDEKKWKDQISYLEATNATSYSKTRYSAFKAVPAKIKTSIEITIDK
jgi:hypothetical protein